MITFIEQFNSVGKSFIDFVLPMLIQSSVLIIILLAIDMLLRKRIRAVFRYWIWMIVLVKLILPPTLSLPTSPAYWFGHEINERESIALIPENISTYTTPSTLNNDVTAYNNIETGTYITEPTTSNIGQDAIVNKNITVSNIGPKASMSWQGLVFLSWLVISLIMLILLIQRMLLEKD